MALINQKGRRRYDSGQGSNGTGALAVKGFGEPGVWGVCISWSKKDIDPICSPCLAKLVTDGVGKSGTPETELVFVIDETESTLLSGVPGGSSAGGVGIGCFKERRLDDEKLFLSVGAPGLLMALNGDKGMGGA